MPGTVRSFYTLSQNILTTLGRGRDDVFKTRTVVHIADAC